MNYGIQFFTAWLNNSAQQSFFGSAFICHKLLFIVSKSWSSFVNWRRHLGTRLQHQLILIQSGPRRALPVDRLSLLDDLHAVQLAVFSIISPQSALFMWFHLANILEPFTNSFIACRQTHEFIQNYSLFVRSFGVEGLTEFHFQTWNSTYRKCKTLS